MWFKNLNIFRLTEDFKLSDSELNEKLQTMAFHPCTGMQATSYGWTSPLGKNNDSFVYTNQGFFMICGKKEERVLPTSVVNEILQERIDEIEQREDRKLSKKAKNELKDNLIAELLPRAFTFSNKTYAYIDVRHHFIVIDSASNKKSEELLSTLRKTLGGLAAIPLNTAEKPAYTMTQWLLHDSEPKSIQIDDECELRSLDEDGGSIRCKRHDLSLPEIKNHLDNGKQVIKLAMKWEERLSFILDEQLGVKRLKFLELVQDQVSDIEANTLEEKFDADFAIMTNELSQFLPQLLNLFGGESRPQ